jgi:pimeloyl-[acyl-carrier protein] methyl ester esterase
MTPALRVLGAGPPLALVHGWGLGPQVWQDVAPRLAEHFRVHILALPGYAGSPAAPMAGLDVVADALADALPENATLCGWSLGAMIALACAARHPAQVRRLILVAANGRFVRDAGWPEAMAPEQFDVFVRELQSDPPALLRRFAALANRGDSCEREANRSLRRCLDDGLPADAAGLSTGLELLRNAEPAAFATQVVQPTLVIHGGVDPLMPLAGAQRLSALLGDAALQVFADSAHAPFASQAREFVEQVRRFAADASCSR